MIIRKNLKQNLKKYLRLEWLNDTSNPKHFRQEYTIRRYSYEVIYLF